MADKGLDDRLSCGEVFNWVLLLYPNLVPNITNGDTLYKLKLINYLPLSLPVPVLLLMVLGAMFVAHRSSPIPPKIT